MFKYFTWVVTIIVVLQINLQMFQYNYVVCDINLHLQYIQDSFFAYYHTHIKLLVLETFIYYKNMFMEKYLVLTYIFKYHHTINYSQFLLKYLHFVYDLNKYCIHIFIYTVSFHFRGKSNTLNEIQIQVVHVTSINDFCREQSQILNIAIKLIQLEINPSHATNKLLLQHKLAIYQTYFLFLQQQIFIFHVLPSMLMKYVGFVENVTKSYVVVVVIMLGEEQYNKLTEGGIADNSAFKYFHHSPFKFK
eukprot:TRINITY_DN2253_c0_g1_i2.p2 TRINITY_DN2253_c0_g1~~TRINITY_DN2253_c0_g1_i2.p2  ORF type:complete len:248 (-),score=-10.76 TRINITY_DN2253_c0_g1_i2:3242-3985(-)